METQLFAPYTLGKIELANRIAMAPLTRCRAIHQNTPNDWMVEYYAQRASAGLIITEGTSPSPNGLGYKNIPGMFNQAHVDTWGKVCEAVHQKEGKIFLQMMHTGRTSHSNNLPEGAEVVGASPVALEGQISTYDLGRQPYPIPRPMTTEEVQSCVQEFVESAVKCVEAGFDGVEIHSAHGYLPNQFISPHSNQRSDQYGGSNEKRCRFVLEVAQQMLDLIGKERVGIRISPFSYGDGETDLDTIAQTYSYLCKELDKMGIVYIHLSNMGEMTEHRRKLWDDIRQIYTGTLILCGDYTKETAIEALDKNQGDMIAFGRDYIGNPDLVERLKHNYPLTERNRETWYTDNEVGYTDYSFYEV